MSKIITAAIYARKSVEDEASCSVDNQIERGIAFCALKGWNYLIYRDDGISGKNTDRKDFQRMMRDAEAGRFQYVISYKLDRVSRNVADFANFTKRLNELGIDYISLTENFDTSTPMGRAMMYIAAVFAQLERETTAERVRDNMIDMAKNGFYMGGPVNFGFNRTTMEVVIRGKSKKVSALQVNPEEAAHVINFYKSYLEPHRSVRKIVFMANKAGIRTKNGCLWSSNQMARLLSNPIYCIADEDAYNYFANETNVIIASSRSEFNGKNGLLLYNRRRPFRKTTRLRDEKEWILAVGKHEGIVPGKIWVDVQRKLNLNSQKPPRLGTGCKGLLAYLVKCGKCGTSMTYYVSRKDDKSQVEYGYYKCRKRETQLKDICKQKNINAEVLEEAVINTLIKICSDNEFVEKAISKAREMLESKKAPAMKELDRLNSEIEKNNAEIKNLIIALGRGTIPGDLIESRIKELQNLNADLNNKIIDIKNEMNLLGNEDDIDIVLNNIRKFNETFDRMSFEEKRFFLQTIIKDIIVKDDTATINLFFMQPCNLDKLEFLSRTGKDS